MTNFDSFEKQGLDKTETDFFKNMETMNKCFKTRLKPEGGKYGVVTIDKGNGSIEQILEKDGHKAKNYYQDGRLTKSRSLGDKHEVKEVYYDDNGLPYRKRIAYKAADDTRKVESEIAKNARIVKGNVITHTDEYSRTKLIECKDVKLKNGPRESLYKIQGIPGLDRSHGFSDFLGGSASEENIFDLPQKINREEMKQHELEIKNLLNQGKKVGLKIKFNYEKQNGMPSSIEYIVTVDGKKYEWRNCPGKIDISKTKEYKALDNMPIKYYRSYDVRGMESLASGGKSGIEALAITTAISTVDNVRSFVNGDISAEDMVTNIVKEGNVAGGVAAGTGFISHEVSSRMGSSSHTMIKSIGKETVVAGLVTFGVESFDSVVDYAKGETDATELSYDLGDNAAAVGGMIGGAKIGALAGSPVPVAGEAIGGLVGGMVGYAVASEAYETAVEKGLPEAEELSVKAQTIANDTLDQVKVEAPDKVDAVRNAMNQFAQENDLPFQI
jgi:Mu-like prophage protein